MTPAIHTYPDPKNFTVFYRGYAKEYQGATVVTHSCKEVYKNKNKALKDAKKLCKQLSDAKSTPSELNIAT